MTPNGVFSRFDNWVFRHGRKADEDDANTCMSTTLQAVDAPDFTGEHIGRIFSISTIPKELAAQVRLNGDIAMFTHLASFNFLHPAVQFILTYEFQDDVEVWIEETDSNTDVIYGRFSAMHFLTVYHPTR